MRVRKEEVAQVMSTDEKLLNKQHLSVLCPVHYIIRVCSIERYEMNCKRYLYIHK